MIGGGLVCGLGDEKLQEEKIVGSVSGVDVAGLGFGEVMKTESAVNCCSKSRNVSAVGQHCRRDSRRTCRIRGSRRGETNVLISEVLLDGLLDDVLRDNKAVFNLGWLVVEGLALGDVMKTESAVNCCRRSLNVNAASPHCRRTCRRNLPHPW